MRLTIFSLLAVLLLAFTASAQVNFGIKAGGSLANVTGSDADGTSSKFGFAGGLFLNAPLGESGTIALQPEVLYVMKGTKADVDEGVEAKFKVDYVEVPVLVKYTIPTEGQFSPNFFAGPAVAFKASAKVSAEGESVDIDNVKSVDFGLAFGAGFDLAMSSGGAITFDARYTLGLTKIADDPSEDDTFALTGADDTTAPDIKNGVFMFTLGYAF